MAAVRYKRVTVANCSVSSKASRKIAANVGNIPQLIRAIIMSHTQCARFR